MKWLTQFSLVMRSSLTTLREKVEDPERMLHQLIIDMDEELIIVRASVAEAIADEILLDKKVKREQEQVDQWQARAERALKRGDESNTKTALEQKALAVQRMNGLHTELDKQREQIRKLQSSVGGLEDKIRQARQKRTLLLARLNRANSSRKVNAVFERACDQSAFAQFSRLETRVQRAEAIDEAYDRLEGRDTTAEELDQQFEDEDRRERVEAEFEALKKRMTETS